MLTKNEILTGQYSVDGSPWIYVSTKSTINLDTLEFSIDGSPWYGIETIETSAVNSNFFMWFFN